MINGKAKILCVDNHNDGRGPFTQAYLEILRVWTSNTTPSRQWLFKNVHSAGAFLLTPFTSSHHAQFPASALTALTSQARENKPLHVFNAQKSFDSREKRQIISRTANRQLRGLRAEDFREYDYILCFDHLMVDLLGRLMNCAKMDQGWSVGRARICLVEFGGGFWEGEEMLGTAKVRIKEWATRELGFKSPERDIGEGPWATRLVVIDEAGDQALLRDDRKRSNDIKRSTGCLLKFGELDGRSGRWVVGVIGGRDEVEDAARKVVESW